MAVQAQFYSGNPGLPSICGLQDWSLDPVSGVEDGVRFGTRQTPQQTQFHLQQGSQNLAFDCNHGVSPCSSCNSVLRVAFSQALDAQLELQRQELECILQLQNEKLKFALQEQRKQQLAVLLSSFESRTLSLIRQKEEDLVQATKRGMELQDRLRKAEMESATWQRVAKENEAMVIHLNNTLEQVKERQFLFNNGAEDAESFCDSFQRGNRERQGKKLACKSCNIQTSCVLFLPCRHLCSCNYCEAFLASCPICESAKEATMEVFLV
ncbi:probable BOI-related E3 ubiquitin-protein ligase 2 [Ziziphus jujuba]|uniref:BOI-related E3 ubiquitin-protein ligase 2 n=2 Tax=Ziziphus jujuba TaxID=326968 RepID=A0A978V6F0_ZIZJJ|nr:probable BOI-related E3 ubiquitin-protein ligase 2 [Ziziphus jujuba]XP_048331127.1 probable BOI-related E3 ubiquitin-protein ligase 2 [Ziziphus jujuba]KAH7523485.1 hypothetical protein FEM48_Zijuj06G0016200 [Ziziphus jujuba var. spinosa]